MSLILPTDVTEAINTSGSDFTETQVSMAIAIAEERYVQLLGLDSLPDTVTASQKKALILLAIQELATTINMWWRGMEKAECIKVKDLANEITRLLGLVPSGNSVLRTISLNDPMPLPEVIRNGH